MHYTGTTYQRLLAAHGGIASMSRRGDCWNNAVTKSYLSPADFPRQLTAA